MTFQTAPNSLFTLRRIRALDAVGYRELRLEGLKNHPESFGATYSDEADKELTWFVELLEKNTVFGGYTHDGILVGIVGFRVPIARKLKHKGTLWGMFITPEMRGTGLSKVLVEQVIRHAESGVEEILLTVVRSNFVAIKLYENLGFKEYGMEPQALKVGSEYHDELLMRLPLRR